MSRPLDDLRLAVVMLDGIELKGRCCVVALGIDTDGVKHPLGLWDGSTENATVATTLLANLVERGLDIEQGVLVVIDGAKALRKAVRDVFGVDTPVQRCVRHKECHEAATSAGRDSRSRTLSSSRGAGMQQFVGLDWAYPSGAVVCGHAGRRGASTRAGLPADEDGLAMLVARLGGDGVLACLEMMSGAAWVRERLQAAGGWIVQVADARKAKAVGSLAAKTDKLDARVLAELARRDLVPAGARADVRRPRAQGTPRAPDAPGAAAHLGDEPRPRRPQPVRRQARLRAAAPPRRDELLDRSAAFPRSGAARSPRPSGSRASSTCA